MHSHLESGQLLQRPGVLNLRNETRKSEASRECIRGFGHTPRCLLEAQHITYLQRMASSVYFEHVQFDDQASRLLCKNEEFGSFVQEVSVAFALRRASSDERRKVVETKRAERCAHTEEKYTNRCA